MLIASGTQELAQVPGSSAASLKKEMQSSADQLRLANFLTGVPDKDTEKQVGRARAHTHTTKHCA
jgi:hypothetical protein